MLQATWSATGYIVTPVTSQSTFYANANATFLFAAPARVPKIFDSRRLSTCTALAAEPEEDDQRPADSSKPPPKMTLSALYRYPIKAARAEPLSIATLGAEGVAGDRRFIVTDATGKALTQRDYPLLATLRVVEQGGRLMLSDGARSHNVSVQTTGNLVDATLFGSSLQLVDQGKETGTWLSGLLGGGGGAAAAGGSVFSMLAPLFGQPAYRLLRAPGSDKGDGSLRGGAGLSDLAPLLLICEESLSLLNSRRAANGQLPVPMDRFRPNLVVSGCPAAHAEDSWKTVKIGGVTLQVTRLCPRCTVPDVQQQTGRRDPAGPMRDLRDYRSRGPAGTMFGVYLGGGTGEVRVGDAVEVVAP